MTRAAGVGTRAAKTPAKPRWPKPLARLTAGYRRERPLGPYMALFSTYAVLTASGAISGARRRGIPALDARDGALLAVAAFKLSRLATKDKVTGFVRAPFARFVEEGDGAEVNEAPRGEGIQRAIGELVTCPFCFTQWTLTALVVAWWHAPEATRLASSVLAAAAAADVLHVGWTKLESAA